MAHKKAWIISTENSLKDLKMRMKKVLKIGMKKITGIIFKSYLYFGCSILRSHPQLKFSLVFVVDSATSINDFGADLGKGEGLENGAEKGFEDKHRKLFKGSEDRNGEGFEDENEEVSEDGNEEDNRYNFKIVFIFQQQ